jgi:DNA polymerase III sliding clamp (beta) subunit (PCNA family)
MRLSTAKTILSYMQNISSPDETRPSMRAVLIEPIEQTSDPSAAKANQLNIVATDGHKLSKVTVSDEALYNGLTAWNIPESRSISINAKSADMLKVYIKELKTYSLDARLVPTKCTVDDSYLSLSINEKPIVALALQKREFPRYQPLLPNYNTHAEADIFEFAVNIAYLEQLIAATKANLTSKRPHDDQLTFTCLIDKKAKKDLGGYQTTLGPILLSLSERTTTNLLGAGDNSINRTMIIMPCKTAKFDKLNKSYKDSQGEV